MGNRKKSRIDLTSQNIQMLVKYQNISKENPFPKGNFYGDAKYKITVFDLRDALKNMIRHPSYENISAWSDFIEEGEEEFLEFGDEEQENWNEENERCGLFPDSEAAETLFDNIMEIVYDEGLPGKKGLTAILKEYYQIAEKICMEIGKDPLEREYTDEEKENFLDFWNGNDEDEINSASETEKKLFLQFAEDLAEKENPAGLHVLAYGFYRGSTLWKQDFTKSRDYLLQLMESDRDKTEYANTLGYIYFYGRCSDGKPDYAKAYQYFNYAALGGVQEARYKIADMYREGIWVKKDPLFAFHIYRELYSTCYNEFMGGEKTGCFADVAYRMGICAEDRGDIDMALCFYLQAKYAIHQRRKAVIFFGDGNVQRNIENALDHLGKETEVIFEKPGTEYESLKEGLKFFKPVYDPAKVKVKLLKNGNAKITLSGIFTNDSFFLTLPQVGFCDFVQEIKITAHKVYECDFAQEEEFYFFDLCDNTFVLNGEEKRSLCAESYEINIPQKGKVLQQ